MSDSFGIRVVTPAGELVADKTNEVTLPSSNGEIGVLPNHTKYTGLLGTGILEYYGTEDKQIKRLVISGGFCTYSSGTLTLLADSANLPDQIDKDSYAEKRSELTNVVETTDASDPAWEFAKQELDMIEAIDRLISH